MAKAPKKTQPFSTKQTASTPATTHIQADIIIYGVFFFTLLLAFSTATSANFTIPKLFVLRIGALAIFLLTCIRSYKQNLLLPSRGVLLSVLAMAAWFIFSTFFATHPATALHGVYGRYNGLFNQLLYLGLFLAAAGMPVSRSALEKIIMTFITAVLLVALYVLVQHLHLDPLQWPSSRPGSTIGNPVIVAAIIGLAIPFSLYFTMTADAVVKRVIHGSALALLLTAIVVTQSRGPWLGSAVAGGMVLAAYAVFYGKRGSKTLAISITTLLAASLIFLLLSGFGGELRHRLRSITSPAADSSITQRLIYYNAALEMIKQRPLTGSGFETFRNLYPGHRPVADTYVDILPSMVHNGYLQLAQSAGLPALALYLAFLAVVYRQVIAAISSRPVPSDKLFAVAFIAAMTGFLIQDLSGWQEISLNPLFWIIAGCALAACRAGDSPGEHGQSASRVATVSAAVACVFALGLAGDAYLRWQADYCFSQASAADPATEWTVLESRMLKSLEFAPEEPFYLDQAGLIYYRRYAATGDTAAYEKGHRMFERGHTANSYDSYILLHAIELDGLALQRGLLKEPSAFTLKALTTLPPLDKNNPAIFETLAKFELGRKQYAHAEQHVASALRLGRTQPATMILSADILREQRRYPEALAGYRHLAQQLEKDSTYSPAWLHARMSIAMILFNQGKQREVLQELDQVTAHFPKEAKAYVMQGDAWAALGDLGKAKILYEKALQHEPGNPFARRALEQLHRLIKN